LLLLALAAASADPTKLQVGQQLNLRVEHTTTASGGESTRRYDHLDDEGHPPSATIRITLADRERHGWSLSELSRGSGMPAATGSDKLSLACPATRELRGTIARGSAWIPVWLTAEVSG
jgi:hypothetical protein